MIERDYIIKNTKEYLISFIIFLQNRKIELEHKVNTMENKINIMENEFYIKITNINNKNKSIKHYNELLKSELQKEKEMNNLIRNKLCEFYTEKYNKCNNYIIDKSENHYVLLLDIELMDEIKIYNNNNFKININNNNYQLIIDNKKDLYIILYLKLIDSNNDLENNEKYYNTCILKGGR